MKTSVATTGSYQGDRPTHASATLGSERPSSPFPDLGPLDRNAPTSQEPQGGPGQFGQPAESGGPGTPGIVGTPLVAASTSPATPPLATGSTNPHKPSGPRPWITVFLALAFLATAVGSFLLGRSSVDESATPLNDEPLASPSDIESGTQAPEVDPGPRTEPTPVDPEASPVPTSPPTTAAGPVDPSTPGEEPVVAVATAVSPSVVQIAVSSTTGQGSLGSGFIYDDEGRILTNAHVVGDADEVNVRLSSGTQVTGIVLGADEISDVAVVQVTETEDSPPAVLATGVQVEVGQLAVALGSPFGLEQTVTSGIVSAINRPIEVDRTDNIPPQSMTQTDAAINSGNSGGPLADREGRVIGINSAIFSLSGGNDGVGFAIPIDRALGIAELLVAGESIDRGLMGVGGRNPTSGRAGAVITDVTEDGGADRAGIEVDDLIVAIDDRAIRGTADLSANVRSKRAGDEVKVTFVRDGEEFETTVTLGSE